jgi:Holliday junction DNA helicase RuvA
MIAKITGKVILSAEKYVIIEAGDGVGYKIFVLPEFFRVYKKDEAVSVWTFLRVREDEMSLYGFMEYAELEFFELILTVSGVGPKSAMNILSIAPLDILKRAVAAGDVSYLTKVSGIGRKIAEKIVLELKEKMGATASTEEGKAMLKDDQDAVEALQTLGYSQREAREALKEVPESISGASNRIKEALKHLGKN